MRGVGEETPAIIDEPADDVVSSNGAKIAPRSQIWFTGTKYCRIQTAKLSAWIQIVTSDHSMPQARTAHVVFLQPGMFNSDWMLRAAGSETLTRASAGMHNGRQLIYLYYVRLWLQKRV